MAKNTPNGIIIWRNPFFFKRQIIVQRKEQNSDKDIFKEAEARALMARINQVTAEPIHLLSPFMYRPKSSRIKGGGAGRFFNKRLQMVPGGATSHSSTEETAATGRLGDLLI